MKLGLDQTNWAWGPD